jgi:PAS domain S-box-containing protein
MKEETVKILLIEDNQDDSDLIQRRLEKSVSVRFDVTRVKTLQEGMARLASATPDLILSDLGLPDSHGLDTVTKILCEAPQIPLVVLSGFDDEATAIKAVQAGAQDYLVKGQTEGTQIERSLTYAIERARLQRELEQYTQEITRVQNNLLKILDNNADAIIVVNGEKQVLFANPAAEAMLGSKKQELLKKPFGFPLKKGKTSEITIGQHGKEKKVAEMSVVGVDWEGKPAFLASLRDVTERKRADEALRESEDKFSKAFRSGPQAVAITGLDDGRFFEVNDAFVRQMGYTCAEVIGKNSSDINIWADPEQRAAMVKKLKEKGKVRNEEYRLRTKTGAIRIWQFSAELINIGNETCILSVATDITESKEAEEKLRFSDAAFKSIHDGIIATDVDFKITIWNETSERIFGISAEDAIGKRMADMITMVEDYPHQNEKRFNLLINQGYGREEQLYRTPRGDVWVDAHAQAIESNGQRTGWVTLVADITERRKAEEAIKSAAQEWRTTFDSINEMIAVIDKDRKIVRVNQSLARVLKMSPQELIGRNCQTMFHGSGKGPKTCPLPKALRTKKPAVLEYYEPHLKIYLEETVSPVIDEQGEVAYYVHVARDITERKEAEEKLRRIDEMKKEFLSNVSHELRTPLQSISGFTKLIMNGQVPDEATRQEFLQIIDRESQHLGSLIDNLLDMSRLEAGRFEVYRQPTPVRDIFTDAIKTFHGLARDKKITLNEEIPPTLPEMEVDAGRLRQVIANLLNNAVKFSEPGSSVTVRAEALKDAVRFRVIDHGTGISPEAQKHLFERFYREEGEKVRGGTGLGLYISKQIIDAHGGRIWAESKPGEGSTFSFTLPLNNRTAVKTKGAKNHGKEDTGN